MQVAVEEAMACGIGVCMTCVLPVRGADKTSRFVRACVDGPVFDALKVRWSDVGTLPEQGLRLRLIVPEVRRARLLVQLGKSSFELRDVKDAPLAPVGAASCPRASDECPIS